MADSDEEWLHELCRGRGIKRRAPEPEPEGDRESTTWRRTMERMVAAFAEVDEGSTLLPLVELADEGASCSASSPAIAANVPEVEPHPASSAATFAEVPEVESRSASSAAIVDLEVPEVLEVEPRPASSAANEADVPVVNLCSPEVMQPVDPSVEPWLHFPRR